MAEQIIVRGFFSATDPGFVRPSGGGFTAFLRADGVWTPPPGAGTPLTDGDKGDVIVSAGGTSWIIQANSVDNSRLAQMSATSIKGNALNATANASDLTPTQVRTILGLPEVTWNHVAKTADTSFTSTTLVDVPRGLSGAPALGWDLVPLHSYHFRFVTIVQSAAANTGIGLALATPTAATFGAYGMMIGAAVAGPSTLQAEPITSSNDPVVTTGVETIDTGYVFLVEGVIIPSAPGPLTLRARNEVGATSVIVRTGSFGMLMDRMIL